MQPDTKKILKFASFFIFFTFIFVYAFFRSYDLIFGIKIRDVNLESGLELSESIFEITGNAKNAIHLTLNGREISIDQTGNFNEYLALLPGYNKVSIIGRDKFGLKDEKNYQVIRQ